MGAPTRIYALFPTISLEDKGNFKGGRMIRAEEELEIKTTKKKS
jgi:hypothetical protein